MLSVLPYYKCVWQNLISLMITAALHINIVPVGLGNRKYLAKCEHHVMLGHHDCIRELTTGCCDI